MEPEASFPLEILTCTAWLLVCSLVDRHGAQQLIQHAVMDQQQQMEAKGIATSIPAQRRQAALHNNCSRKTTRALPLSRLLGSAMQP